MQSKFSPFTVTDSEQEDDAIMPPKQESEAHSPVSVTAPLNTVGQEEPEPETARAGGSSSAGQASLKRPFEESFATLPSKGSLSKRYGQKGSDLLPPWKTAEGTLLRKRWRGRRVQPSARARSTPPSGTDKEKRHWQRIRELEAPSENRKQNIRYSNRAPETSVLP